MTDLEFRRSKHRWLRRITIAYFSASVLAVLLSRPLLLASASLYPRDRLPSDADLLLHVVGLAYLFLELALGPIGFLFNL
jgi:hypothetical protein